MCNGVNLNQPTLELNAQQKTFENINSVCGS